MNFPCSSPPSLCDEQPNPATTYSSESADSPTFIATAFSPSPPLLGANFTVYPCMDQEDSHVSQDDAQLAANRAAVACANPCSPLFSSAQQQISRNCADGTPYFFTVPAGAFTALSQLEADRMAISYGEARIGNHSICMAQVSDAVICLGQFYSAEIVTTGPDQPFTFQLVQGAVPPGITMTMAGATITFTGTASVLGTYPLTIRATSSTGVFTQKTFSLLVTNITTPSALPDANFGVAYNQALSIYNPGSIPVAWSITDGSLPTGLSLDPDTGIISGTVTVGGVFTFTVQADFGDGTCSKQFTINSYIINFDNLAWSGIVLHPGSGVADASFTGHTFSVEAQGGSGPDFAYVEAIGTMNYTGPLVHCVAVVTVSSAAADNQSFFIEQDGVSLFNATLTAAGVFTFPFIVAAGTNSVINVQGGVTIGDPNRLFAESFSNGLAQYSVDIHQVS